MDRRVAVDEVDDREPVLRYDGVPTFKGPRRIGTPVVQQPQLLIDDPVAHVLGDEQA